MNLISLFFIFLFVVSALGILHTYFFYPVWMMLFTTKKIQNEKVYEESEKDNLPTVAILFAAYNEESVLDAKLKSTFKTSYPLHKLNVYVGSDASTDRTNEIVKQYTEKYPQLKLIDSY